MLKKKLITILNFRLPVMEAKNDSVVGPTFGQYGIKGMDFCKKFNEFTNQLNLLSGLILKVLVTIFKDRTFSFTLKTPPLYFLLFIASSTENVIFLRDLYKIAFLKAQNLGHLPLYIVYKNILNSLKKYKYSLVA